MTRSWKTATFATLLGLSSLYATGTAGADTMEMPKLGPPALDEPAAPATSVTLPGRGMTMTQVEHLAADLPDEVGAIYEARAEKWWQDMQERCEPDDSSYRRDMIAAGRGHLLK